MSISKATGIVLKFVCLVLLIILTVFGYLGHFDSEWKKLWDSDDHNLNIQHHCIDKDPECPEKAIDFETTFIVLSITTLIFCAINVIASIYLDFSGVKKIDAGFHCLAGLFITISGIYILVAGMQIDSYLEKILSSTKPYPGLEDVRSASRFWEKIMAGSLGIIDGVAYFATAGVLFFIKDQQPLPNNG